MEPLPAREVEGLLHHASTRCLHRRHRRGEVGGVQHHQRPAASHLVGDREAIRPVVVEGPTERLAVEALAASMLVTLISINRWRGCSWHMRSAYRCLALAGRIRCHAPDDDRSAAKGEERYPPFMRALSFLAATIIVACGGTTIIDGGDGSTSSSSGAGGTSTSQGGSGGTAAGVGGTSGRGASGAGATICNPSTVLCNGIPPRLPARRGPLGRGWMLGRVRPHSHLPHRAELRRLPSRALRRVPVLHHRVPLRDAAEPAVLFALLPVPQRLLLPAALDACVETQGPGYVSCGCTSC